MLEVLLFTITACVQINVTLQQYYFQITQVSAKCLLVPSTNRQITIKSPANSPWRWLGAMTECHHVGGTRRCSTQRRHIQRFFSPEKHRLWPTSEIVDDSNTLSWIKLFILILSAMGLLKSGLAIYALRYLFSKCAYQPVSSWIAALSSAPDR